MPFTVSHVAAVLPVVARRHTTRVVPAAWVIGSMVPDVPWFFTGGRGAGFLHSLPGLFTADLALGLVLFALWRGLLFAPVRDLVPPPIGRRLPEPVPLVSTRWGWAALGAILGATTHLVWDSFTHEGRWAVSRISWLHTEHAGVLGSQWAQYASGLVGGGLVLFTCLRLLARTTPGPDGGWVSLAQRWQALGAVVAAGRRTARPAPTDSVWRSSSSGRSRGVAPWRLARRSSSASCGGCGGRAARPGNDMPVRRRRAGEHAAYLTRRGACRPAVGNVLACHAPLRRTPRSTSTDCWTSSGLDTRCWSSPAARTGVHRPRP